MQLASLKATIERVLVQAEQFKSLGRRYILLVHTSQILGYLLDMPGEGGPGWPRAALAVLRSQGMRQTDPLLADIGMPVLSGELAPAPLALIEVQDVLLTLLDLPEVQTLGSLAEIHQPIQDAITTGSLRYNGGDIRGCARLYLATALALLYAQIRQGFSGQTRALEMLRKDIIEAWPLKDLDERAWALRQAFERALKVKG